ncbi:MAG TPA: dihydrodipicolinate synthase family protein [Burkholderiales bacterium]|nr:dihydrodipicolinate synthase family protein [Burkholderiales bacterium]
MADFQCGLTHAPVTPFKRDNSIDYDTYAKLLDFHIRNGAQALALPMPEGEDLSLTDTEQRRVIEFAVKQVKGRVPLIAHVSDAGTMIAVERARYAEKAGVDAIVSHPPYFWHPKPAMVVEHIVALGSAVGLPFFVCTPPVENVGTHLTADMFMQLVDRLKNLRGIVDSEMDFVFMEDIMGERKTRRAAYDLISGADYMVPPAALGGKGAFSSLAAIAPKLVKQVYELCANEDFIEARKGQEQLAVLRQTVRHPRLETGLKAALRAMGRDCGDPRPPSKSLGEVERGRISDALAALPFLSAEPRGW